MPEPIRNRFQNASIARDGDYPEASRTRPGFGADEDPLAELARIVGETTQFPHPSSQSVSRREPTAAQRDYPRRDTSWRDPQAQTTVVRAGITPKPMPGQLADLEAELFNEVRSENLRQLPPAPDLAQLGLPDARMSTYPVSPATGPTQVHQPARPAPDGFTAGNAQPDGYLDDEVTLPMHSVLRATPPSARVSEGNGMQQPPRFNPAPVQQPPQVAQHDAYADQAHYGAHEDYDPAGAFGAEHYGYEDPDAAYYAELEHHLGHPQGETPAHAPVGNPGYPPIQPQYAEHADFNAHYEDEGDAYGYPQQVQPRGNRRPQSSGMSPLMLGAAAIVGVLLLGTGSVFAYRAMSSGGITGSGVPLIKADTKPMKETVAQQPIANASGPNLDVARADNQDKLVTQAEDPVDKIPVKPVRLVGTNTGLQNASLAPVQRVRSVIVRPDGTVVTPDDTGAKPTPAIQPIRTASIQTTTDTPVTPPPAPVQTQPVQIAPAQPIAVQPAPNPALPPLNPVTNIETSPVMAKPAPIIAAPKPPVAQTQQPVVQPPVAQVQQPPVIKPVKTTPVPHIQQPAPEAPIALGPSSPAPSQPPVRVATATPPTAPAPHNVQIEAGAGDYMVQISSARSESEANSALKSAVQKYAAIGAKPGDVQQADLGARGTYYRARLAGGTHEQALALCAQIKSQGGDCVVSKR